MRWHILRTLLHKEALRHLANRGGLVMIALLVVASMLLAFSGTLGGMGDLAPAVKHCYVDYWEDGPLVAHLRSHVPPELKGQIHFRQAGEAETDDEGRMIYPPDAGAIQLRPGRQVLFWHPGADGTSLAPFEAWFWKEMLHDAQSRAEVPCAPAAERRSLTGGADARSGLATALVVFGVFFVCVYLQASLTCEERERGVLLAQALSPASPGEILAAKFLFYPALALLLAAVLAGAYQPRVLAVGFFWLALAAMIAGAAGVGLTIASLARTQRAASLGAMGYMLAVALLLFICRQQGIPSLSHLALEYHGPRMLHAALAGAVEGIHFVHLLGAALLATGWTVAAAILFRRYGWQ
jgi:hypothetical protein